MALQTLLSARAVLESSRGAGGTPTRFIYFENGSHDQSVATIRPVERRNSYFESYRAYPGLERNTFSFGGAWSFQQAPWWLNLHVDAEGTGNPGGTVAVQTWSFNGNAGGTADSLKSASLQFGYADSIGATLPVWQVDGVLGEELTLTWAKDDVVRFESQLMAAGTATQLSAFTGSLTDATLVNALGTNTSVYIDASTIGTTADANILDASWTLTNGFTYLDTLNGTNAATRILRPAARTWRLQVTRYYANDTELDAYLAKTLRKIRVRTTGPTIAGGSTYRQDLDLYGVWDAYEKTEADGLGVERMTLVPQYDATATTDFSLALQIADASIT